MGHETMDLHKLSYADARTYFWDQLEVLTNFGDKKNDDTIKQLKESLSTHPSRYERSYNGLQRR